MPTFSILTNHLKRVKMKQSKHINIRVSSELKKEYQKLVERRNQTLSEVIKAYLNSELKKEQRRILKGA